MALLKPFVLGPAVALIAFAVLVTTGLVPSSAAQEPRDGSGYDAGHLAAARSFMEATRTSDLTEDVLAVFLPRVGAELKEQIPDVGDDRYRRFMQLFAAAFHEQRHMFREASERVFADHLSKDDLEAGAAFYASPPGANYIDARSRVEQARRKAGVPAAGITLDELAAHLSDAERAAFESFVATDVGKRIASVQASISRARARFGALLGRHLSPIAGAWAVEQMKREGKGL
jgi:hypothetical protein